MDRLKRAGDCRDLHSAQQACRYSLVAKAAPAKRLDQQGLQHALNDQFLARIIDDAFLGRETDQSSEPRRAAFRCRDMDLLG